MIQQQLNDAVAIDTAFKSENINQLTEIEKSLASSPHIRQSYSSGDDTLNKAVTQLPRFKDAESRTVAIRIIRHLANHRFTVHNTRFVLAAVARHLQEGGSEQDALALLELLGDAIAGPPAGDVSQLRAFWHMGSGVMGATGFDLPADKVVRLASKVRSSLLVLCCRYF